MKTSRAQMILGCLRQAMQAEGAKQTDGQLLRRYLAHRDETAFAVLVRRHGPMVLAVCRRLLHRAEDAEDAFQAAFVILVRKGRRIADRQTIGGWLHGVAYRVALDVRRRGARRLAKEQQVEDMPHPLVMPEEDQRELLAALDRELARLPEKYRLPVILCELEGRSRKDAAQQIGIPEGTLSSRLATARKTLAKRIASRGASVTGASLAALFASEARAVVPGPLVASTVRAAGGVVSAGVVALAEGVLKAMLLTKIKSAALALLFASVVGAGAVGISYRSAAAADAQQKTTSDQRTPPKNAVADKDDLEALRQEVEALRLEVKFLRGKVQAMGQQVQALEAEKQQAAKTVETKPNIRWALPSQSGTVEYWVAPAPMGVVPAPGDAPAPENRTPAGIPQAPTIPLAKAPQPGAADKPPAAPPEVGAAATPPLPATPYANPPFGYQVVVPPAGAGPIPPTREKPAQVEEPDVQAVQLAAAQLMTDPHNKQAQQTLMRILEKKGGAEVRVKEAAANLHGHPNDKQAQVELKAALEQLDRENRLKSGTDPFKKSQPESGLQKN